MTAKIISVYKGRTFLAFIFLLFIWSQTARAQSCSLIDFTSNSTRLCAPDSAKFQATGAPNGSSYYWNLGSGFFQSNHLATKIYTSAGFYDIALIVQFPNGNWCDTIIKKGYVKVYAAPQPVISASERILCYGPDTVRFTDSTLGSVTSNWIVDGTPVFLKSFDHKFATTGNKNVTLTITDSNSCTSSITENGFIRVINPPTLNFCITATQNKTNIVALFRHSINLKGNIIKSYSWQFPGGTPSSSVVSAPPPVTYSDITKKYDAILTVVTNDNCVHTFKRINAIEKFIGSSKDSMCTGETTQITNLANSPTSGRGYFSIEIIGATVIGQGNADQGFTLQYPIPGKYNLVLKFKYDANGCDNVVTLPQYIDVKGPKVLFESINRYGCIVPDTILLDNRSLISTGTATNTFTWHITDLSGLHVSGSPLITNGVRDTSIILFNKGEYNVKLVGISTNGCRDSVLEKKYIRLQDPIADFTAVDRVVCAGEKIVIDDIVTPPDDPLYPYTYNWVVTNADSTFLFYNFSGKGPNFLIPVPGEYDVMLIVKNGDDCIDTIVKARYLTIKGIRAEIISNSVGGCQPYTTQAEVKVLQHVPNSPWNLITYEWIVAPGTGVTMGSPNAPITSITFKKSNCYDYNVTLTNVDGCSVTVYKKNAICIGVKADFSRDTNLCKKTPVQLYDSSSFNPTYFRWYAQPADVSFYPNNLDMNPTITFNRDTVYKVTHVVGKLMNNIWCLDSITKEIKITPIKAYFKSNDSVRFCAPLTNYFINQSVGATNYFWDFGDGTTLLSSNPNPSHNYTLNNSNGYTVKLVAYSDLGCSDSVTRPNLMKVIGPTPSFLISNDRLCAGGVVSFTNKSTNTPTFVFDYGDNTSDTNKIIPHSYNYVDQGSDSTIYHVVMLAKDGFCATPVVFRDTIIVYKQLTANFAGDTLTGCAPLKVKFTDLTPGSAKRKWYLNGDPIADDSLPVASYSYMIPGKYDIKLSVRNQSGCKDSISKPAYINVTPTAVAKFSHNSAKGCHELNVSFTNQSKNYISYYMDYGDKSAVDSDTVFSHTYYFDYNLSADSMIFTPSLTAFNGTGCRSTFKDTIVLYRKAPSNFSADATTGCPPFPITFRDSTPEVISRKWDFNGDWVTDDTAASANYIFTTGSYDIRLITTSSSGCTDTLIKAGLINIFPAPTGDFSTLGSSVCPGDTIHFETNNVSVGASVRWEFGDPVTFADTAWGDIAAYPYSSPGTYSVAIAVIDINGCSLNVIKPGIIVIPNIPPPPVPELHLVTVENDAFVKLAWAKNSYIDFRKYDLFRTLNGIETLIYSSANIDDTTYADNNAPMDVSQNSYGYSVYLENNCGKRVNGRTHASILLKVTTSASNANSLIWTRYTGWTGVMYRVYRSRDGGPFDLLTTVGDTIFTDASICDFNYCYFIEATGTKAMYTSMSNSACNHPPYIYQTLPLDLRSSTVIDNAVVFTSWGKSGQPNVKEYIVDRFDDNKGWQYRYGLTTDTVFTDDNVNVNKENYHYQVSVTDQCENSSPISNAGSSILLKSRISNDRVLLTWNNYQEWINGVAIYKLQIHDRKAGFRTIKEIAPSDTFYSDEELHKEIDTAFCYRIVAIENSGEPDSSISNISCSILPSRIFIPSAFTPNEDGLNDLFTISSTSLFNLTGSAVTAFEMRIFNRWGALAYFSNDLLNGWDGTINGQPAQPGIYMYSVNASGLDNTDYNIGGTVTLLK